MALEVHSPGDEYYFQGPKLGEGAYGEVFAMFHRSLGVKRAVKIIRKSQLAISTGAVEAYDLTKFAKDIMDKLLKPALTMGLSGTTLALAQVVDTATIKPEHVCKPPEVKADDAEEEVEEFKKPPLAAGLAGYLHAMLNSFDFESVAREASGGMLLVCRMTSARTRDDEITLRDNHLAFQRITMRPRILVNVREIDMTTMRYHQDASDFNRQDSHGVEIEIQEEEEEEEEYREEETEEEVQFEFAFASYGGISEDKAAKKAGVPYMLPTLSSYTLDEMLEARTPDQVVFSQLYVNPERSRSEEYVTKLEKAGVQALFVTVDAPQLGRREKDMRNKFTQQGSDVQGDDEDDGAVDRSQGATRAISSYIDPGLNWEDVPWLKSITKMKVLLKGVQCAEDAVMAYKAGLSGCVLSNHGGRQLDTCRPGIEVLPEVMEAIKAEGATKENFAVFIDGGVRRGGDVFKAVALGAQAVGVGRPVLYSLASYGQNGIVRMVHMLQDELQMVMRLAGTPNIPSITEKHVITTNLADHIVPLPVDNLTHKTYQGLEPAGVPYMLPTLSSYTLDEMLEARTPDQVVFSQLYVNPERSRSEEYVTKLEKAGVQALFVTVDAPQLGRREKDMRNKFTQQGSDVQGDDEDDGAVDRSQGATRAISSYIDPGLNWEDVPWLKSITKMKVLLKGVQCAEDAVMAYKAGLSGCVLSNHGGRQLDTCRPGIEVLPEVMEAIKAEGATKENFAVFIDGGVRRGGDVFKAVALGAQAVGVGRPVLYSLASYGQNGIVRMVHMLQDELQMVMRLAGTPNIPSITEKHVITTNLADHIVPLPVDNLTHKTYQGLEPAARL
ncbi:Cytochrome b2, mitochondrial [Symbiodinium microadriaticum]|uniref:Cytochrome b2, mitochondrial n=1 Tax=Symbiodinium microadriaticum TaxID=2951 RepID=A0A1Q9DIV7_SYMMI|nr:Cytochrome b2, mitochondrial [Symbiodinium microadriaticum]